MVGPPHSTVTFNYLKRIYNKTSFYMPTNNLSDFLKISPHQSQNSRVIIRLFHHINQCCGQRCQFKISRCGERRCFGIGADDQAVIISLPNRIMPKLYGYLGISVFTPLLQKLSTIESNERSDLPDRSTVSSGLSVETSVLRWNRAPY